jgi:hypothetical protein
VQLRERFGEVARDAGTLGCRLERAEGLRTVGSLDQQRAAIRGLGDEPRDAHGLGCERAVDHGLVGQVDVRPRERAVTAVVPEHQRL